MEKYCQQTINFREFMLNYMLFVPTCPNPTVDCSLLTAT